MVFKMTLPYIIILFIMLPMISTSTVSSRYMSPRNNEIYAKASKATEDLTEPVYRRSSVTDEHEQQKIMSMTKEILDHFKASHMNIYNKDNHWEKLSFTLTKENIAERFVQVFTFPLSLQDYSMGIVNSVTLHLFLDFDFATVDLLLKKEQKRLEQNLRIETVGVPQSNYFLIKLPNNASEGSIKEKTKLLPLRYDSLVFGFKMDDAGNRINLFDLYKIGESTDVSLKPFGVFDSHLSVAVPEMWERRNNMEGYLLRAAAIVSRPNIDYLENGCQSSKCFLGIYSKIWHTLQAKMNFTYIMERKTVFGVYNNESWNGVIGMLHRKEIDIAPQDFSVTKGRASVVDYLPGVTPTYTQIFIRNPDALPNWMAYIEPLNSSCWLAILVVVIFVPVILYGISLFGDHVDSKAFSLQKLYTLVIKAFIMRSISSMPKSSSNRVAVLTIMLTGVFVFWFWRANLIAFISVRKTSLPVKSLQDVLLKSNLKMAIREGTAYVDEFRYAKEQFKKELFKERIEPNLKKESLLEISKSLAEDSSYAFYDSHLVKEYEPYQTCKIIDTGIYYSWPPYSFAMPKNSPYFAAFQYNLRLLKESGVIRRYQEAKERTLKCSERDKAISGQQCFSAFVLLAIGAGISGICLVLENWHPRGKLLKASTQRNSNSRKNFDEKLELGDVDTVTKHDSEDYVWKDLNAIKVAIKKENVHPKLIQELECFENKIIDLQKDMKNEREDEATVMNNGGKNEKQDENQEL